MTNNQSNTATRLPDHGPLNEEGREILLSLKNVTSPSARGTTRYGRSKTPPLIS